jgi:redox-sensitive bicupin YhaK (pirin superfamily)
MNETQMITIRQSADRGHSQFDWLDSHHSFSFGQYQDQRHMGFYDLRVINQDVVAAGKGFNTHGHADMEIISYVLRGTVDVDHYELMPGDSAAIDNVADLSITAKTDAEFLLFSLRP